MQTSKNNGKTFGKPVFVTARPGADRSQWFPYITTNDRTGRALLFYYDQGIADSGDLSQVSFTYSDDGGRTWAAPRPISPRPFHAGWGNDTSQPNLGDYNQAVVNRTGDLLAAYAVTHQVGFRDGEPTSPLMTVPEPTVSRASFFLQAPATTVDLRSASAVELHGFSNGNGFLDAGERALVSLQIRNYVTNPMSARTINGALAVVESKTPGAHTVFGLTTFPTLAPGETRSSSLPILLQLDPGFDAGSDVTFAITVFSLTGLPMNLEATLHTGTPVATPLIAETFDGVAPGALPAGWIAAHGAGSNTVPWTTSNTFCGTSSNAAFHVNANDGATPANNGRWERLISPAVIVPADADWVEVELDVCADTEDDPAFNVQVYDGLFLRIFDGTPGDLTRSVLAEAFEQDFTTGTRFGYPKHFPRSGNPFYFEEWCRWRRSRGGPALDRDPAAGGAAVAGIEPAANPSAGLSAPRGGPERAALRIPQPGRQKRGVHGVEQRAHVERRRVDHDNGADAAFRVQAHHAVEPAAATLLVEESQAAGRADVPAEGHRNRTSRRALLLAERCAGRVAEQA